MKFLILAILSLGLWGETTLNAGRTTIDDQTIAWDAPVFVLQGGCRGIRTDSRGDGIFGASRGSGRHTGVDWYAPNGTNILSPWPGVVEASVARASGGAGQFIQIRHTNGLTTKYAHLSQRFVSTGQQVTAGQAIGQVGDSGNAGHRHTHDHLHFALLLEGRPVNPAQPGFFECQSYAATSVPGERTPGVPVCETATNCP